MKAIKTVFEITLTLLTLTILISCAKDKSNQSPTIKFIEPENDLVIEHDTVLSIIVEPFDEDGDIQKVELFINGTMVITFNSPPYQYYWHVSNIENVGVFAIKAIAYDDKGAIGEAQIGVEINDFRIKYLGDFYFKVITESWMYGESPIYDTSFYSGVIRKYEYSDSENDLYIDDDGEENSNEKITIEFKSNTKITSILNEDGSLIPKSGHHYYHYGEFTCIDTINLSIDGLGGLGGGWNYEVVGIRECCQ